MSKTKTAALNVPDLDAPFFTAQELAEKWRCSTDTVLRLAREKKLAHTRIRGAVRISKQQAEAYLREQTIS